MTSFHKQRGLRVVDDHGEAKGGIETEVQACGRLVAPVSFSTLIRRLA